MSIVRFPLSSPWTSERMPYGNAFYNSVVTNIAAEGTAGQEPLVFDHWPVAPLVTGSCVFYWMSFDHWAVVRGTLVVDKRYLATTVEC